MKRGRWSITAAVAGSMMIAPCFSQTYQDYFAQYGVEIAPEGGADYAYPERAQPDASQTIVDLSYRVHDVLPFDQDKNAGMYMVIPKAGIVFPVVLPTSDDKTLIDNGEVFDHFKYLTKGALRYYGNKNKIFAVHSSYKKSDTGRYKTVGQAFIILRPGDKVFFYYKNKQGTYDFAEYTVTSSQETEATNVGILGQEVDNFMITAYTCYPVGSSEDRRYITARVTKEVEDHSSLVKKAETPKAEQQVIEKPSEKPIEEPIPTPQPVQEPTPQPEPVQDVQIQQPVAEPTPQEPIQEDVLTPIEQPPTQQVPQEPINEDPQESFPVDTLIAEQNVPQEHGAAEIVDTSAPQQAQPQTASTSDTPTNNITQNSLQPTMIEKTDVAPILTYEQQARMRKAYIISGILLYKKMVTQKLHAFGRQQRIKKTTEMFSFLPFLKTSVVQKPSVSRLSLTTTIKQAIQAKRLATASPNK